MTETTNNRTESMGDRLPVFPDRRHFLCASLGMGLGAATPASESNAAPASRFDGSSPLGSLPKAYEEILARTRSLVYLGRPKSWWIVRHGFLPFAPERVLILEPRGGPWHTDAGDRWAYRQRETTEKVRKRLVQQGIVTDDEQLGLIVRLTSELARYYDVSEFGEDWAYRMAARESLGSTGIGHYVAVPHQYQVVGRVKTVNAHIDWWMILLPGGTDCWPAPDDQPVHVMFTHIYSRPSSEDLTNYLVPLSLLSMGLREIPAEPDFMIRLSRMDRICSVRLMNQYIVQALKEKPVRPSA